jgi:hypothetical protein
MTRDKAINLFCEATPTSRRFAEDMISIYERLGMLKLDDSSALEVTSNLEVLDYLTGVFVEILPTGSSFTYWYKTTRAGALEILDVLSKHGFVIMRKPHA